MKMATFLMRKIKNNPNITDVLVTKQKLFKIKSFTLMSKHLLKLLSIFLVITNNMIRRLETVKRINNELDYYVALRLARKWNSIILSLPTYSSHEGNNSQQTRSPFQEFVRALPFAPQIAEEAIRTAVERVRDAQQGAPPEKTDPNSP